mmetsp:Transcript_15612/g.26376  ORF Transcript_15612/g.26376 Transcript_15612/m.26376 type:complete len:85 (+) Transcript_15612:402-656(+)
MLLIPLKALDDAAELVAWLVKKYRNLGTEIVEIDTNYIDQVICYTEGVTIWNATKGDPFTHNHIKNITVYKGAIVKKVAFDDAL